MCRSAYAEDENQEDGEDEGRKKRVKRIYIVCVSLIHSDKKFARVCVLCIYGHIGGNSDVFSPSAHP